MCDSEDEFQDCTMLYTISGTEDVHHGYDDEHQAGVRGRVLLRLPRQELRHNDDVLYHVLPDLRV